MGSDVGDGDGAGVSMTEVGDEVVGSLTGELVGVFVGSSVRNDDGVGAAVTTDDGSNVSGVGPGVVG